MGVHISESWPDLLEPNVKVLSDEATRFDSKSSMLSKIFDMKTSGKSYEKFSSASTVDDFESFTGTVGYSDTFQGFDTRIEFPEFVKGIKIERKLKDDDETNIIASRSASIGHSYVRSREKVGAQVWNEAFTTDSNDNVTHSEGGELCASDHAYTNGSTATQSNEGTTAFSATSVEATRQLMCAFRGDNQEIISINPDTLLVPIGLEETGFEIINSKGKINTDANNVNFHEGKYKLMVWKNFLTDADNWFMIDYNLMKQFLKWYDRIPLEVNQDSDSDTLVAKYIGYCRFWRWWINWRFCFGHLVG